MPHFPGWVVGGGIGKLRQVAEAPAHQIAVLSVCCPSTAD